MNPPIPSTPAPRTQSGAGSAEVALEQSVAPGAGSRRLHAAVSLLVCATALVGLRGLSELDRSVRSAPTMCAGAAEPPDFAREIAASRIVFLTSETEPLRSEQFFCVQRQVVPRVLHRQPLEDTEGLLDFEVGVAALAFAPNDEELEVLRARLVAEAKSASVELRARARGWAWFEAVRP